MLVAPNLRRLISALSQVQPPLKILLQLSLPGRVLSEGCVYLTGFLPRPPERFPDDELEEALVVTLRKNDKLLAGSLRDENGECLEKLGKQRGEVDKDRQSFCLWIMPLEDFGHGSNSIFDLCRFEQERHSSVVVHLTEIFWLSCSKLQLRHGLLHDLSPIPHEGIYISKDEVIVHLAITADQDWPASGIRSTDSVMTLEVLWKFRAHKLADVFLRSKRQRALQALGSYAYVQVCCSEVLQDHYICTLRQLSDVNAPQLWPPVWVLCLHF
eukprot:CAMPEP_0197664558 /NCGR_PEP_ID=MMETSP1338-20131121/58708_1 /TAXON_ID=43686 ORGANISM="Pelagodinium beii, Strain RCC1491" /NCGR_SAMPLE_ID=MMETSP1338 /ASSEMBLY_ACC=CAM_ASM_000754 /LENGTH=269 /DNA_ID=CAMNT_0043243229 /DNA_START=334 /DNA_END=1144 /DNA_ORIENTATION=-